MLKTKNQSQKSKPLKKCPTGIIGLDEITFGGLPKNRCTLICGGAGSGKSIFGIEFVIRGAEFYKEPGLFVAFEENEEELNQNITSLGFNIKELIDSNLLVLDYVHIDRAEFKEIGSYNLDGLFIRLSDSIDRFKIKRVVLDTIEVLFGNFTNEIILRSELQRLFRWFKEKNVTVVVTAEQGVNTFSRYGLEEYVADCVILLDNRMHQQISTRRLRVAKYRGSSHGNNEYPFIINDSGISIIAITSIKLDYPVSNKHVSSGIKQLDTMFGDKGFYSGSSILVSGAAGNGKTSIAASFSNGTCELGKKCFYFTLDESVDQIIRNMNSIGIDLSQWINKDLLRFHAINPYTAGLEAHLADIQRLTNEFNPSVVIIDPIANLKILGPLNEVQGILSILVNFFKNKQITTMFTSLVPEEKFGYVVEEGISNLMDTWVFLQYIHGEGERNRGISILKSRGMSHSNQLREVILSDKGIHLQNVYIGQDKVLAGSARLVQATKLEIENSNRESELKHRERQIEITRKSLEAQISALHETLEDAKEEAIHLNEQKGNIYKLLEESRIEISKMRMADISSPKGSKR
ncbi:MAG: circadian clock protein KaiC [Nitrosopumilus sp.]|nr:circadian clock protein KaiC [Nitrosopumilus sp.]